MQHMPTRTLNSYTGSCLYMWVLYSKLTNKYWEAAAHADNDSDTKFQNQKSYEHNYLDYTLRCFGNT